MGMSPKNGDVTDMTISNGDVTKNGDVTDMTISNGDVTKRASGDHWNKTWGYDKQVMGI